MGGQNFIDLTDHKFGKLTVKFRGEDYIRKNGKKKVQWWCECDCQLDLPEKERELKLLLGESLRSGLVVSCGCHKKELVTKRNVERKKYNQYDLSGEYGIGFASNNNQEFYFDLEDYDKIKDYTWFMDDKQYIKAHANGKTVFLHRIILNVTDSNIDVDHIKHVNYDNRKGELRIATSSQNQQNKWLQTNNTSGYPGLVWKKDKDVWEAYITSNKKRIYLGRSQNKEHVIRLRKEAEEKYFGEWSYDNSQAM